jgi:hypothetical protein
VAAEALLSSNISLQAHVTSLSADELMATTRMLVWKSNVIEADLLVHLGEIDERKLYLERAYRSMHEFCVESLGFSEDAAYNRIAVARAARRFPAILESIRSGDVHLFGMRLLAPYLTEPNHEQLLKRAAGKSKAEMTELIASIAPRPAVPATIRKMPVLPNGSIPQTGNSETAASSSARPIADATTQEEGPSRAASGATGAPGDADGVTAPGSITSPVNGSGTSPDARANTVPTRHRPVIEPLSSETFRIQFTATRSVRDKLRQAQDLLAHSVAPGDLNAVFEHALDAIIDKLKKRRFAVGVAPRPARKPAEQPSGAADAVASSKKQDRSPSRYIPSWMKRAIYQRDGGRCTYVDVATGRRCTSTRTLEYDHVNGFAIVKVHNVDDITLRCRAHNMHRARQMYGSELIEKKRADRAARSETRRSSDEVPPRDEPSTNDSG